ncbi:PAS domain-containing protein [uncultured Phenylobacterium sp.]|uniref:motility/cell cycle regulatory protein MopJ n=1 Tax=uncultured Phenylobacterium sp. TaxID=349273 RepID=UPI0025E4C215|nr:PAS domain-containing protein [uncultured Phenylobacterium sp.]
MTQIGKPEAAIRAHEELFGYWASLRGEGPTPARKHLDPRNITRLLPTVSLTEVLPGDAMDFRIRLAGTALYGVYGREITGRRLGEVYNSTAADYWREELGRIVRDRRPGVGVHSMAWRGASHLSLVWIRLPLSTKGAEVDVILGYDAVIGMSAMASGIRPAA